MTIPETIYVTFEDGLHVGVFFDPEAAERLNAKQREVKKVDPVTVGYVRVDIADQTAELLRVANETLALVSKQFADMKAYADASDIKFAALVEAVRWVVSDASYVAPELAAQRSLTWIARLAPFVRKEPA